MAYIIKLKSGEKIYTDEERIDIKMLLRETLNKQKWFVCKDIMVQFDEIKYICRADCFSQETPLKIEHPSGSYIEIEEDIVINAANKIYLNSNQSQ